MDFATRRNRLRRLRLLQSMSQAYPDPLTGQMLLELAARDPELKPTLKKVRRSLQYLADIGFVEILNRAPWVARCLPAGIDYLEGDDPGLTGIRHPTEFLREAS